MPREDWVLALAIGGLTLASRWPYRARLLPTWDAVQFALALDQFDVVRHQPHPPGYILYVALGRLVAVVLSDAAATLGTLAVAASVVAVLLLYRLGWQLYGRGAAVLAALGLAASPLFWAYGVVGLPYAVEAALTTGIALECVGNATGERAIPGRLGATARARRRGPPVDAAHLGATLARNGVAWVPAAWPGAGRSWPGRSDDGGAGSCPMLWLTGPERYLAAAVELYESTVHATTLLGGGWTRNVVGLGEALLVGVGVFLPVLVWGLRPTPARRLARRRPRGASRPLGAAGPGDLRPGSPRPAWLSLDGPAGLLPPGGPVADGDLVPGSRSCERPLLRRSPWRGPSWSCSGRTWRSSPRPGPWTCRSWQVMRRGARVRCRSSEPSTGFASGATRRPDFVSRRR